jgi:hypothetical protein
MEIGVADAAEQDFDLHIAISWITTLDFSGRQGRCFTRGGISFRVVRSRMHVDFISFYQVAVAVRVWGFYSATSE